MTYKTHPHIKREEWGQSERKLEKNQNKTKQKQKILTQQGKHESL